MHPIYYKAEKELSQKSWYKGISIIVGLLFIAFGINGFISGPIWFLYAIILFIFAFIVKFTVHRFYIKKHISRLESSTNPSNITSLGTKIKSNIKNLIIFLINSIVSFYILAQEHYYFVNLYERNGRNFPGNLGDDIFVAGILGLLAIAIQNSLIKEPKSLLGKIMLAISIIVITAMFTIFFIFGAYFGY